MANKKEPSIDEALNIFKDVMQRASLTNYVHVNAKMISENSKGNSILIIPESDLWMKLLDDEELKDKIKEIDISDPKEHDKLELYQYADNIEDKSLWFDIDINEFSSGKIIRIKVSEQYEYDVPVNKNVLPIKLKKAEFNNISYRVFTGKNIVLALKKKFVYEGIPQGSFTIIRLFKVV